MGVISDIGRKTGISRSGRALGRGIKNVGKGIGSGAKAGGRMTKNVYKDVTGKTSAEAAERAANVQADYGRQALDLYERMYEEGKEDVAADRQKMEDMLGRVQAGQYTMDPEEFDTSQYAMPDAFDASQYQMPGEFSFTADDFERTPYYDFLQEEAARGINRSAAAGGGLGSGATGAALMDRSQAIAGREFGNQYQRAMQTHQQNLGQALGEREFGYGQYIDELGRAQGEREFGYRDFLGSYGRRQGEVADRFNREMAALGGQQTMTSLGAQLGQGYGQQTGAGMMGIGNVLGAGIVGGANARQQALGNLLQVGGQLGSAAIMASDRRLKRDIKKIGTYKGFNKYKFKYIWSPIEYIGLMADEVKKRLPEAVINIKGFDHVNYGVI